MFLSSKFSRLGFALVVGLQLTACKSPEDRAASHLERGTKLLEQKEFAKAGIEFKNALKLKQNLVGAWLGLADIEERNRNWENLAAILRTVTVHDPNHLETRLRYARLMLLGNMLDEALKSTNFVIELDARNVSALALKSAILLKLNDNQAAVETARQALAIEPNSLELLVVLAAERLAQKDGAGALDILSEVEKNQADNLSLQLFKIKIYETMGNTAEVEQRLRHLVRANRDVPAYRSQLVHFYIGQNKHDQAEKELRAMAAEGPANHEAGLELVRFMGLIKGSAAAQQELTSLINAGGVQAIHYKLALADLHAAGGRIGESEEVLQQLASDPDPGNQAQLARIKLAELHVATRKLEAAEPIIADILRKDSRQTSALKLRGALSMERGQAELAINDLRQALNDQPRSPEIMQLLATAYERAGLMELADKQFADAMRAANFDAGVAMNYVAFLRRRGNAARAEDTLVELAGRWPQHVGVLTALAEVRLSRQNWSGAQEIADAIKRLGSDTGIANQVLAASLNGKQQYSESIRILQDTVAASPGAIQPMYALVNTLVRAKQIDRAVAFLQTILAKSPENADAHVLLGSIHALSNAHDSAVKSFETAMQKQPNNLAGYRALAEFHLRQNKLDDALGTIRSALKQAPNDVGMRLALAGALERKGDYDAAISEYETVLRDQPGSIVAANNLASLLSERRTDQTSLDRAYAISAMLRKTQVPHFKDTLGWIHYRRGEHKAAIALLEEAVADLPTLPQVRYHLGMSYIATGELSKAGVHLRKALEQIRTGDELEEKVRSALKRAGA